MPYLFFGSITNYDSFFAELELNKNNLLNLLNEFLIIMIYIFFLL